MARHGPHTKLNLSLNKKVQRGKRSHIFPGFFREKERERKKGEKVRASNFSLRSTEIRWSVFVGPKTKVHLLDEGYAWVLKT